MLKETFIEMLAQYCNDRERIVQTWRDIEAAYSAEDRYYHNFLHLNQMLQELLIVKHKIINWNSVVFALYYHDFIYNPLRTDNEEKSAEWAGVQLQKLMADSELIGLTEELILATKRHETSANSDVNYFIDSDLSVLGADWNTYAQYAHNIRNEYRAYPAEIYNTGRQKVLNHFLEMERIFKTEEFHTRLEDNARLNMQKELEMLFAF